MAWLLPLAALAVFLVRRLARRRRTRFSVLASESFATPHVEMSKRQTAKTRAALEAASAALR